MCFSATCPICSGVSWRGCGKHIPGVFASVPEDEWCTCEPKIIASDGAAHPPQAVQPSALAPVLGRLGRVTGNSDASTTTASKPGIGGQATRATGEKPPAALETETGEVAKDGNQEAGQDGTKQGNAAK